jgi:hypothetical protein
MNSGEYLGFLFKFILGALGFGIITHTIGNYVDTLKIFIAPIDLIFIITLIYLNRNKFSEIISTLEV